MFSYRQTIKAYPSAGGAYIVTKDNFGLVPAQIAGVALLTDYVLTVAVSVVGGRLRHHRRRPRPCPYLRVPMCLFFIALIAIGNLRGVQGVGADLRGADVPVPRDDRIADAGRFREALDGNAAPRGDGELPRRMGREHAVAGLEPLAS